MTLYDTIGVGYNNTRRADPYLLGRMTDLLQLKKEGRYLDLGCGTGNYSVPIAEQDHSFCGVDPSREMLELAKARSKKIEWKYGIAENIPAADNSFDGTICNLTIHHWKDISGGFKELHRVLKTGGRIVIFTSLPEQMKGYWLCHYFPEMMRLSALQMPDIGMVKTAAKEAELEIEHTETYSVKEDLQDHFLYIGKHDPERYFNETIRKGISSFSSVSNLEEVNAGLTKLKADIRSGEWTEVRTRYENNIGDYIFVVLRKP